MIRQQMDWRDWATLVMLSVLFGGSFFFSAVALQAWPPLSIVAFRVALAALALAAVVRFLGLAWPRDPGTWVAFGVMGLLNNAIPFTLLVWGQSQITSGLAAILNATTPIFTVLVAHAATADEKLTPARLAGVAIGLLGVAAMFGLDALQDAGSSPLAQLACLGAALCYACAAVYGRRFRRLGIDPRVTAGGQLAMSSLLLVPLALAFDQAWLLPPPSPAVLAALAALGLLSTALGFVLYFRLLASAGATNVLLVTLLVPVTAALLGATVLGEQLAPRHAVGIAAIACGLGFIDGRPLRWFRRGAPAP